MPIAADTPTDRVEQLIILTERLNGLVDKEIDLLKTRRPSELEHLADERNTLSRVYTQEMSLIRQDKNLVRGVAPQLIETLKKITGRFRDRLAEHDRILTAIRTVSERMIKSVAADVNAKSQAVTGYGNNAHLRKSSGGGSLTLNQVV